MQYWHFGTKQFVTWQTLELSDGQPAFLDFSNDLGQNPYSDMWRIVLINASAIINQAHALAASTRIDSLESQRYEPLIELACTIPNVRLHFMIIPQVNRSNDSYHCFSSSLYFYYYYYHHHHHRCLFVFVVCI
jgi:hypothetical protein